MRNCNAWGELDSVIYSGDWATEFALAVMTAMARISELPLVELLMIFSIALCVGLTVQQQGLDDRSSIMFGVNQAKSETPIPPLPFPLPTPCSHEFSELTFPNGFCPDILP